MRYILEYDSGFINIYIDEAIKGKIREWIRSRETSVESGPERIEDIVSEVMSRFKIGKHKRDAIRSYLTKIYSLSDELSVIMDPNPQLNYKNPDQVQSLYY